jgi:hypothetical protein
LALLAAAIGAAPAYADPSAGPEAPAGEPSPGAPESVSSGGGTSEPPAEEHVSSPAPEQPEAVPVEAVVTETPAPTETTPPPAETTPPPAESPAPAETPLTESPTVPGPERTTESSTPEAPAKGKSDEKGAVTVVLPAATAGGSAGGTTGETPPGNLAAAPTGSMVIDLGEATVAKESGTSTQATIAGKPGGGGGGDGSGCALQGLGGPTAGSCATASWMRSPGTLAPEVVTLAPVGTALEGTVAATRTSQDDPGGAAGGGRPMPPSPAPAPGGASGGAAAGGAGGVGLSGFLAFAVLLLLAAPRAMRRLRLACQPWLTAFFVLIPERPG